jgi:hypothetical protein
LSEWTIKAMWFAGIVNEGAIASIGTLARSNARPDGLDQIKCWIR